MQSFLLSFFQQIFGLRGEGGPRVTTGSSACEDGFTMNSPFFLLFLILGCSARSLTGRNARERDRERERGREREKKEQGVPSKRK